MRIVDSMNYWTKQAVWANGGIWNACILSLPQTDLLRGLNSGIGAATSREIRQAG
jgi:hypothetical protein